MTITNPRPKQRLNPFRRYEEASFKVKILHHFGKVAVGEMKMRDVNGLWYVGRWRNRYCCFATQAECFARLRQYRAEHRAHEQALISYSDAVAQLLIPPGQLRLFLLTFGLKSDQNYTRRELRKAILSRRGKFTACQLRCLSQIVIDSPTLY